MGDTGENGRKEIDGTLAADDDVAPPLTGGPAPTGTTPPPGGRPPRGGQPGGPPTGEPPPGGRPPSGAEATHETGGVATVAAFDEMAEGLSRGATVGRYLVLERLGAGAMGIAYAAYDPELDRKIALKMLRPRQGGGTTAQRQARMVREAKAIARLSHPNVVGIFDVGVQVGQVFLAMEYLSGGTLTRWSAAAPRTWREALDMFLEVGQGLEGAHAEGLVHRDFKPDNVILDKNGVPKVVDFGLVRVAGGAGAADEPEASHLHQNVDVPLGKGVALAAPLGVWALDNDAGALTRTGALTGTPAYMAPEQFMGHPADARADQFAFCVALYEALYGYRPFAGETVFKLADSLINGSIREPPKDTKVPGWLRRLVYIGLSRKPEDRFPSMSALLAALRKDPAVTRRRGLMVAGALAIALVGTVLIRSQMIERREQIEKALQAHVASGRAGREEAQRAERASRAARAQAFEAFDNTRRSEGEGQWHRALEAYASADRAFEQSGAALRAALVLDPDREPVRKELAEVMFSRAVLAGDYHNVAIVAKLVEGFAAVDPGLTARWNAPGRITLGEMPPGITAALERYNGHADGTLALQPVQDFAGGLPPGSYRLSLVRGGQAVLRLPFVLSRGQALALDTRPPPDKLPDGFVYIPAGDFLFGEADESLRVSFLDTTPLRPVHLGPFLIAREETTYGQWIEYLNALPSGERRKRTPRVDERRGGISLRELGGGRWELMLRPTTKTLIAAQGEPLVYPERSARARQDWLRFPVAGISANDAEEYLAWLRRTGRVPNARLCTEKEWERAARGADDRVFPHGDLLLPDDANIDVTYSRRQLAFGPDQVGSHTAGDSPFGVHDLCGNIIEMTTGSIDGSPIVARGGGYYWDKRTARSTNREPMEPALRFPSLGIRVCADL